MRWLISKFVRQVKTFDLDGIQVHVMPASAPFDDDKVLATLSDIERAHASSIRAPMRRQEFVRSRWLVRHLTGTDEILKRGPHGEPSWPNGWTGSITHKDGIVAVCMVSDQRQRSLGIDLERADRVGSHLTRKILVPAECKILSKAFATQLDDANSEAGKGAEILGAAFSVKESLFKSHFPLGKTFFYFHDAEITSAQKTRRGGKVEGVVKIATTPQHPPGSSWMGTFLDIEIDAKSYVLSCVQTDICQ